ncbi:glycosyltransferase [Virgibacillus kimchii]
MKKIKVIFFIYQMGAGGAARTMLNILNNMDRTKFTPVLVTLDYDGSYENYINEDIKFIKLKTKRLRSAILPLAKVIRTEKADIVFSTIPNYNTIAIAARVLSFTRAKNIVREAAYLGGSFRANMKLRVMGMLYKLTSQVVALSYGVKENIVRRYKVKPEKIRVIYNPVDVDNIAAHMEKGEIDPEHEEVFRGDAKVLITAGRLVKDKDHETLINAFAKVNEKMNARLVILGEGELEEPLKNQAKSLHLQDYIHFLGFQQNPYVYFKHADLFVLSSIREGFGHVLTEALATGTPIVSTDCRPGAMEVLDSGAYGILCKTGDANDMAEKIISTLKLDQKQTQKMIDKGISRANEFHARKIVKEYEETFSNTVIRR